MMNQEKEYEQFMIKLMNKAEEINKDFNNLSYTNKKRVEQNINFIAIMELLKSLKEGDK